MLTEGVDVTKGAGSRRAGAQASIQFGLRIDPLLLARVDLYAAQLQEQTAWASVTRADALRAALVAGLDALGVPQADVPKAKATKAK